MKEVNIKALIYAYYLSKFDKLALTELGIGTWNEAYELGFNVLGEKTSNIKNMRDGFDPIMPNKRVGWYQKGMSASRIRIHEQYSELSFENFTLIIQDLLKLNSNSKIDNIELLTDLSFDKKNTKLFSPQRASTGIKAEEYFIEQFNLGNIGSNGKLIDTRNNGCGYDFVEDLSTEKIYYEVKGRYETTGGVMLTNKEWEVAKQLKKQYNIILISNVSSPRNEIVKIINNPASSVNAKLSARMVVQTSWVIAENEL